jgi:hypothetical protein
VSNITSCDEIEIDDYASNPKQRGKNEGEEERNIQIFKTPLVSS